MTQEYRYQGRRITSIFCGVAAILLLAITLSRANAVLAVYPILTGLGALGFLRLGVFFYTQRLRLEPDAIVITSYFGRQRIPYMSVRGISYSEDDETKRVSVTLTTTDRDLGLYWYDDFSAIAEEVRRRCPNAKIDDTRQLSLPSGQPRAL